MRQVLRANSSESTPVVILSHKISIRSIRVIEKKHVFNRKCNAVRTSAICGPASIVIECASVSGVVTGQPLLAHLR